MMHGLLWGEPALPEEPQHPAAMNKSIFLSKTFWVQVASLLSLLFPAVLDWLKANPVEFVAALAAVNILVRFVTSGRVSLSGDFTGKVGLFFVSCASLVGMAASAWLMSSCSGGVPAVPVRACVATEDGTVCYSSKGGIEATIHPQHRP